MNKMKCGMCEEELTEYQIETEFFHMVVSSSGLKKFIHPECYPRFLSIWGSLKK